MGDRQLTKAGKSGAYCTACGQHSRVERALSRPFCPSLLQTAWLGWFLLLLGSCLVSESSQILFFRESSLKFSTAHSGREGPSGSSQLQGLPENVLSWLLSYLRSFPVGGGVSVLEETVLQPVFLCARQEPLGPGPP